MELIVTDYQSIITNNNSYFEESSFFSDILRSLGWLVVKFLTWICDGMQVLFDSSYQLLNIMEYKAIKDFVTSFRDVFTLMITISCIAIGLILIFSEKKPPVLKNLIIGLACIYMIPQLITVINAGIISTKNEMITGSFATETVISNMTDLTYIANNNFDFSKKINPNLRDNKLALSAIKPDAHVKSSQFSTDLQKQVFNHRIDVNDSGQVSWVEIGSKGWLDFFDPPYYYRYKIDFLSIYMMLISSIVVFLFSSYAVVKMLYELLTSYIAVTITSLELTSGQKTMKILEYGFNAYVILFSIPIMIRLFLISQTYISATFSNPLVKCFLILFCALLVVDGPSLIEKLFNYDLGVSSGSAKIMSFMRAAQQMRMQHHFAKQGHAANKAARAAQREKLKNMFGSIRKEPTAGNNSSAISEPNFSNKDGNTSNSDSSLVSEPTTKTGNSGNNNTNLNMSTDSNMSSSNTDSSSSLNNNSLHNTSSDLSTSHSSADIKSTDVNGGAGRNSSSSLNNNSLHNTSSDLSTSHSSADIKSMDVNGGAGKNVASNLNNTSGMVNNNNGGNKTQNFSSNGINSKSELPKNNSEKSSNIGENCNKGNANTSRNIGNADKLDNSPQKVNTASKNNGLNSIKNNSVKPSIKEKDVTVKNETKNVNGSSTTNKNDLKITNQKISNNISGKRHSLSGKKTDEPIKK